MPEIQPCISPLSKKSALRAKQLEVTDPKVLEIWVAGAEDLFYENDCELAAIGSVLKYLAVKVLNNGTKIIIKDDPEVFIPKGERPKIMRILDNTHACDDMMIRQCKSRLYWPGLCADLHKLYQECQQFVENMASKSKPRVEVHPGDLVNNIFPGESLSCDFGVYNA